MITAYITKKKCRKYEIRRFVLVMQHLITPGIKILERGREKTSCKIRVQHVCGFRLKQKAGWGWSMMGVGWGGVRVWGGADTLVFDSSGGHYLREKRALMGILSSRHAQASAPSSPAAINWGEVCIIR